jgi:hypothetical protein
MSTEFFKETCQSYSDKNKFGLCDDPAPANNPAYIDENNGDTWIAVVDNERRCRITFTAVDNCINLFRTDGKMAKRCDGVLTYENHLIFVELKDRSTFGASWIKEGESQLMSTIDQFKKIVDVEEFDIKEAYIANAANPKFRSSQAQRMQNFLINTGFVLNIINRIIL